MRTTLILLVASLFADLVPQVPAANADRSGILTNVQTVKESTIAGRKVVRYTHPSLDLWNYEKPQCDYFCLVYPKTLATGKVPLRVILHSAGGGGELQMTSKLNKDPTNLVAGTDESSYGLYLDCLDNKATDWWWGYRPTIQKSQDRYKNELCPTEKRLLATVDWVSRTFPIDSNQVYLSGISMGGSGSLGLGMCHGDIFAAIAVIVPAGVEHVQFRMQNGQHPEPPPILNFSSQSDGWSRGQERLIADCQTNHYSMVFAWGPYGHSDNATVYHAAAYEFPWLSIRKNVAYPVFTNASTDDSYPGFMNLTAPQQKGQINAYFRWKNITDTARSFVMELRLLKPGELHKPVDAPARAIADVTLRRLQQFHVQAGKTYKWQLTSGNLPFQSGQIQADAAGLLTIPKVKITDTPIQLRIEFD